VYGILASHLGQCLGQMERWDESIVKYREAVERKRKVLHDHPAVTMDLSALAGVLMSSQQYEEAVRVYTEVGDISRRLYGDDHVSGIVVDHWLSVAEWKAGRKEEGLKWAKQAVGLGEHLMGKGEGVQVGMLDVLRKNLAEQLRGLGRDREAEAQEQKISSKA
jgi:tetratricopeptide (TPR) repeat protein